MMTDAEVAAQIERADAFTERLREAIAATAVDPTSPCADAKRRTLRRITETLDQVEFVTICNLSNLDAALTNKTGSSALMALIEVHLMACGAGRTLDFANAAEFLRQFEPMVELARRRRVN